MRPNDVAFGSDMFKDLTGFDSAVVPRRGARLGARRRRCRSTATRRQHRQMLPNADEQLARAEFGLAWHLHQRGRAAAAERHFVRAGELSPDDFTIRRGSMPIRGIDPMTSPEFLELYQEWTARGRPYYRPRASRREAGAALARLSARRRRIRRSCPALAAAPSAPSKPFRPSSSTTIGARMACRNRREKSLQRMREVRRQLLREVGHRDASRRRGHRGGGEGARLPRRYARQAALPVPLLPRQAGRDSAPHLDLRLRRHADLQVLPLPAVRHPGGPADHRVPAGRPRGPADVRRGQGPDAGQGPAAARQGRRARDRAPRAAVAERRRDGCRDPTGAERGARCSACWSRRR